MFGINRLRLRQPETRKSVYEFGINNRIGQAMWNSGWGAVTIPIFGFVLILYWLLPDAAPAPLTRVHEFVHVAQDAKNANFLVTWKNYALAYFQSGYRDNEFEAEAYKIQAETAVNGLPEWAEP